MDYLHSPEDIDPLDIDKPGYYIPQICEIFLGCQLEYFSDNIWKTHTFACENVIDGEHEFVTLYAAGHIRMKWLQAKDIMELGFPRIMPNTPMYQRGSYTISAYRLLDPTTSRLFISQNGIRVFEGHVKNKSELKRILTLNEINFVDQ